MTVLAMVDLNDMRIEILQSAAKNLALSIFQAVRDSSSPAAPQNDSVCDFFRSL
jgi:hypothetical protein